MASNASWAVVLPDNSGQSNQLMQTLYMRNMQQQRLAGLQQQRELIRQQNLSKFVGENFKDSNYATGTAADPVINQMTSDARGKFAKLVHDNPNMDEGELEMQMQQDLGKISQYSSTIKAGRAQIDAGAQHYQQQPGIDADALKQGALSNLLYTTDQDGKKTLKPLNQIDLTQDYLHNTLNANPELFVQGDTPYTKSIEDYKPKKGGDTSITDQAGVTTENKYTDQLYPWQSLSKDQKGNVTGVQTNSLPATLADGTVLNDPKTGKPLPVVDDETYNAHASKPGVKAALIRDVQAAVVKDGFNPADFLPGTEGYNVLAKNVLYNKLNAQTPSEFTHERKKTDATFIDKMQAGFTDALGRTLSKADERREADLLGSRNGKIRLAANFDPSVVNAGVPYTDPGTGKQFIDVTDPVGGFNTMADKKSAPTDIDTKTGLKLPDYKQVSKILVDPSNPGTIYTLENGQIVPYTGKDIDALLTRHAPANGYKSLKEAEEINDKIPIKANVPAARQARAEMEFKRRQAQAATSNQPIDAIP